MTVAGKSVPIGVIGVGHLGSLHAKILKQIPQATLVGVYDLNAGKAESVAREFSTKAYPSAEALLQNVEAVSIATPTSTHFALASEAVGRGIHTFLEKPVTQSVEDGNALAELAARRSVKVQVGHIERFNPALLALRGYTLRPMFIESHRLSQFNPRGTDVAVVLDLMIHDIDIILSLVRSPVAKIDANGVAVVSGSVDIANARLQFENGCVANVTASRISQKKMRKMRLFQRDAYISIDFSEGKAEVFRLAAEGESSNGGGMMLGQIDLGATRRSIMYERPAAKQSNALQVEFELFLDAILHDTEPVVTCTEAVRALQVAQKIMETIRSQSIVL